MGRQSQVLCEGPGDFRQQAQRICLKLIDVMHANVDRYLRIYLGLLRFQVRSQADHRALPAACAHYDAEAALGILTRHLANARDALSDYPRREER